MNRYEEEARREIAKVLGRFVQGESELWHAVDALMSKVWWSDCPEAPNTERDALMRDGASLQQRSMHWDASPFMMRLLWKARGLGPGDSFRLTKHKNGVSCPERDSQLLAAASTMTSGSKIEIGRALVKDPRFHTLKPETIAKLLRAKSRP